MAYLGVACSERSGHCDDDIRNLVDGTINIQMIFTGRGGSKPRPIDSYIEKTDSCWIWKGATIEGYGIVRRDKKAIRVYRMLWIELNGPVPEGLELDHLCKNTLCVRHDHLEAVTHKENVLRGTSPGALNAKKTHAPCGHPYDAKDPIRRYCKTCRTKWAREYYHRNSMKILARQKGYRHAF